MNAHATFSQEISTAAFVVKALQDAGIGPDDPDYETLIESECDALDAFAGCSAPPAGLRLSPRPSRTWKPR